MRFPRPSIVGHRILPQNGTQTNASIGAEDVVEFVGITARSRHCYLQRSAFHRQAVRMLRGVDTESGHDDSRRRISLDRRPPTRAPRSCRRPCLSLREFRRLGAGAIAGGTGGELPRGPKVSGIAVFRKGPYPQRREKDRDLPFGSSRDLSSVFGENGCAHPHALQPICWGPSGDCWRPPDSRRRCEAPALRQP